MLRGYYVSRSERLLGRLLVIAGYGGHFGYAFAVLHELSRAGYRNSAILVAEGSEHLVERLRPYGDVKTSLLPRRPGEPLIRTVPRWIRALPQSIGLVMEEKRISAVFAGGSNFSILPSIMARALRGSTLYTLETIERFFTVSRAVRILRRLGAKVFLHWEEQRRLYPRGEVVGPVYEPRMYEPRDEGYVLVTTGTLGYPELISSLEKLRLERVVVQTGDLDPGPIASRNPTWRAFRYTKDIHIWIAGASLVITHQGTTAAVSALAYGKPTLVVWSPRVTLGARRDEARIYAEKIGAAFLGSPEPSLVKSAIERIGPPNVTYPNGAERIARELLDRVK